ncbi:hypothetical protein VTK56DRAFT_1245 [Thermocarpiscus australiensis]
MFVPANRPLILCLLNVAEVGLCKGLRKHCAHFKRHAQGRYPASVKVSSPPSRRNKSRLLKRISWRLRKFMVYENCFRFYKVRRYVVCTVY